MSQNLLYDPPRIYKRRREAIRFLVSLDLPFVPDQVFSAPEGVFLYAPGKKGGQRAYLVPREQKIEVFPSPPLLTSRASYSNRLLVAAEEDGNLIISRHSGFAQIAKAEFPLDCETLVMSPQGAVFFDQEDARVWRYQLDHHDPFSRTSASWKVLAENVTTFTPGENSALFLEKKAEADLPMLAYLNPLGGVYRAPSLSQDALYAPASPMDVYFSDKKNLRIFSFTKSRDLFSTTLPGQPQKMVSQDDILCLLYSDFLEIRKKGERYLSKEKTRQVSQIALSGRYLLLFEKEEPRVRLYHF